MEAYQAPFHSRNKAADASGSAISLILATRLCACVCVCACVCEHAHTRTCVCVCLCTTHCVGAIVRVCVCVCVHVIRYPLTGCSMGRITMKATRRVLNHKEMSHCNNSYSRNAHY